jgi:hypothetical protein
VPEEHIFQRKFYYPVKLFFHSYSFWESNSNWPDTRNIFISLWAIIKNVKSYYHAIKYEYSNLGYNCACRYINDIVLIFFIFLSRKE